jgi:uncharacterized coiled-coil protein SlyX
MRLRRLRLCVIPWLAIVVFALAACESPTRLELQRQVSELSEQVTEKDQQLDAQRITIGQLHEQLAKVRGLAPEDLKKIFSPEKIEIGSLSGGEADRSRR